MNYFEVYQSCSLFGALRYFANIRDTVCLINGPTGCAFYARNAVINLNGYFESLERVDIPKIFNLNFNETDVIFGNSDSVREAIRNIVDKYSPRAVFLFNCCVSEIVGCDIDEIAGEFTDTRVIPIHTAGFKGDHKYGMKMAAEIICDQFMPRPKVVRNEISVNILGEFDYFNRSSQELTERLHKIGVQQICQIPGKSTIEDIAYSTRATLNIITCQNASRHMAEIMKERYEIPHIGTGLSLYGIDNTYAFYEEIYRFFNIDTISLQSERDDAFSQLEQYTTLFRGKKAAVVAGTRRALGYSSLLKEFGMEIVLLFSEADCNYNHEKDFKPYTDNLYLNAYTDDLANAIKKLAPDVIFTTLPEMVAPAKYLPRLSYDFAGFHGAILMAKYLYDYFSGNERCPTILINE